jgi:hypothetical protein
MIAAWVELLMYLLDYKVKKNLNYIVGWISETEKSIYQIAWGLKSLFLGQLSQIQYIFRFDKCLSVAFYCWRFCILYGNWPKIWKMKTNILFTMRESFFLQYIEANKISIEEKIQFNSKFLIKAGNFRKYPRKLTIYPPQCFSCAIHTIQLLL